MIKICCELPQCLLDKEDMLNDYDFVLYHQYLKDEVYRNNYLNKRKINPDRIMILDNSAFEFFVSGEQFVEEDFIRVINELKPTYYIVPDVLMDKDKTLDNFFHWIPIVKSIEFSEPYFVPQGRELGDFEECMEVMDEHIRENNLPKNFCIPFHNDFFEKSLYDHRLFLYYMINSFETIGRDPTKDERYAIGRMTLMEHLWQEDKYMNYKFHMLGSHNPREVKFYNEYIPQIETFDSGYPVKLAIEGIKYGKEKRKPNIIIDNFYDQELSDKTKDLIIYNINKMRELK